MHMHTHACMHANEEQEDNQRTGATLLWKQGERVGVVLLDKKRLKGDLIGAFLYLKKAYTKEEE